MKIASLVRTRNEEEVLPVYLANRPYSDLILVVDDHSSDSTCSIAETHERVKLAHFTERPYLDDDGLWMAYQSKHWVFAIAQVPDDVDWVELNDADEVPTLWTQEHIKESLERLDADGFAHARVPFYYLASGFKKYHSQLGGEKGWWWKRDQLPNGSCLRPWNKPWGAWLEPGKPSIGLPKPHAVIHLNWAYEERFMQKVPAYMRLFGYDFVPVDEMYPDRELLPEGVDWWGKPA